MHKGFDRLGRQASGREPEGSRLSRRQLLDAVEWQLDVYHANTIKAAIRRLSRPALASLEREFRLAHGRRVRAHEPGEELFR